MKSANRPAKPRWLDDKLWSVIEDCWSQQPFNRPTAEAVSLRLRDVNGSPARPEFIQPYTTLKQAQDLDISIRKKHSPTDSLHQLSVVPPFDQPQDVLNSTEIRTAQDIEKCDNDSITRCVPIQEETPPSWFLLVLKMSLNSGWSSQHGKLRQNLGWSPQQAAVCHSLYHHIAQMY